MARFIKSGRGRGREKAPDFSGRVAPARLERERGTEFLRGKDEGSGEARSGCKGKSETNLATRRSAEQRERGRGGAKIQARERARRGWQGRVGVNKKPSGFLALAPHRNKARNERRRGTRTPNSALGRAYISIWLLCDSSYFRLRRQPLRNRTFIGK